MSADLPRRPLAEAIGTGILVMFGAGSVVAALTLGGGKLDYAGLGMVALTFGLAIALAIYAIALLDELHPGPRLDHLAGDLVAQDQALGRRRAAAHYVLVR
jgi:glycerol uptake facilitator protein